MRRATAFLLLLAALQVGGCGSNDLEFEAERTFEEWRQEAREIGEEAAQIGERAGRRAEELRDRLRERVEETLEQIRQAVPQASRPAPTRQAEAPIERFLVEVIENVDAYWTTTLTAADIPRPRVGYVFPGPGEATRSACGATADDTAAFYCPADDTIYVGQRMAEGVVRVTGDFGAAFVIAHEYAHNVQQELGWFSAGRRLAVKPFELQADCMAGAWANSVYRAGSLDPGDIGEAQRTAEAVGDYEYLDPQHHGTPAERRAAWQLGFDGGDPSACRRFAPA